MHVIYIYIINTKAVSLSIYIYTLSLYIYILYNIYIHTPINSPYTYIPHTQTHTHIYIYIITRAIYIYIYTVFVQYTFVYTYTSCPSMLVFCQDSHVRNCTNWWTPPPFSWSPVTWLPPCIAMTINWTHNRKELMQHDNMEYTHYSYSTLSLSIPSPRSGST